LVFVNNSDAEKLITFSDKKIPANKKVITYTTDETRSLEKNIIAINKLSIPAKSIVTTVID